MKKLFTLLIMLCCVLGMNAASYNVWVKGKQVTDANKSDVLGDGKVSYTPNSSILTLTNATITGSTSAKTEKEAACIYTSQKLVVNIIGDVTLTTTGDYPAFIGVGGYELIFTTTTGYQPTANLTVSAENSHAIKFGGAGSVTFSNINAKLSSGTDKALYGDGSTKLTVSNCDLFLDGAFNDVPAYGFASITTNGCSISTSSDLAYNTTKKYYEKSGVIYRGDIQFSAEYYGVTVNGTKVTSRTKDYILGANNKQAQYDATSKTLILKNATIAATGSNQGILIEKDADIQLVGTNTITGEGSAGALVKILEGCTATIKSLSSGGVLDLNGKNRLIALYDLGALTISNCTVKAITAGNYGILGGGTGTLTLSDYAKVTAQGIQASVAKMKAINLKDGIELITPTTAKISSGAVVDANSNFVTSLVSFDVREYGFRIMNTSITSANIGSYKTAGVTYNDATKTITLTNVNISADNMALALEKDLNINLVGTNKLTSTKNAALYANVCTSTISGTGTLDLGTNVASTGALLLDQSNMTIKDCSVNVHNDYTGSEAASSIWDMNTKQSTLTVDNATLTAKAAKLYPAIYRLKSVTLNNCVVTTPAGGTWNATKTYFVDPKGNRDDGVKIVPLQKYGITIAGTAVTNANATDVLGDGKISYNEAAKTLLLNNATITATGSDEGILIEKDADIRLVGTNKITGTGGSGSLLKICKDCTTKIASSVSGGVLDLSSQTKPVAIYDLGALTISNCTVNAITSGSYGINGNLGSSNLGSLTISDATVTAQGTKASVSGLKSLTLNKVGIVTPSAATFSSGTIVGANGNAVTTTVTIQYKEYGFEVGGVKVTTANKDNIPVSSGTAKFNPATNVLTLNNAVITPKNGDQGILSDIALDIELVGTSKITTSGDYAIQANNMMTIYGTSASDSKLTVSTNSYGIVTSNILLLNKCAVSIDCSGKMIGIWGGSSSNGSLAIDNATLDVKAANGAIKNIKALEMVGVGIATPLNGKYNATNKQVEDAKGNLATEVSVQTITKYSHVMVNGEAVTNINCSDILGDGTMSYDHATKTITMNNVKHTFASKDARAGILLTNDDFTLNLIGNNNISAYNVGLAVTLKGKLTITNDKGGASLLCSAAAAKGMGLAADDATLTIKNCTVMAVANGSNAYGLYGCKTAALVIDNANVTANGNIGSVAGWASLKLNNAYISTPSTGVIGGSLAGKDMGIFAGTSLVKGQDVVIKAGDDPKLIGPVISDKTIKVSNVKYDSFTIAWTPATDNTTSADKLSYEITITKEGGMSGKIITCKGYEELDITGLDENTKYTIDIKVTDEDGNSESYTSTSATTTAAPDVTVPTLPADATITVTDKTENSLSISWNAASDDKTSASDLQYEISIFADGAWTTLTTVTGATEYKIEGLKDGTEYKIAVNVVDESGNKSAYNELTVSTVVGINAIFADDTDAKMYNTSGLSVGKSYKGIVIINGKKVIKK